MSEMTRVLEDTSLDDLQPRRTRRLAWMSGGLIVVVILAIFMGVSAIQDREAEVLSALEQRTELRAGSRADTIETWLEGVVRLTGQAVNGNALRLFISELTQGDEDPELAQQLLQQSDYVSTILASFVTRNEFLAAHAVGPDGDLLISSDQATPLLNPEITAIASQARELVPDVVADNRARFTPVRVTNHGLVIDVVRPILELQNPDPTQEPRPIAALIVSMDITDDLARFLEPGLFAAAGERFAIAQTDEYGVVFRLHEGRLEVDEGAAPAPPLTFAERDSLSGMDAVFSSGVELASVPWMVVAETDRETALAPLQAAITTVVIVGGLATIMIAGLMIAIWFNQESTANRALATQFRNMAAHIDAQRRILASVTGSVEEFIGLKTAGGIYKWVNIAFARAFKKTPDAVIGLSDDQLFGHGTAERLRQSDEQILRGLDIPTIEDQLYIGDKRYDVQISKTPLTREDGTIEGIVSVTRDVTELVEQRRLREQAVRQSIYALVKTVELSDPYLVGHSRLLSSFSVLVGKRLNLSPTDLSALEIAANLSQIGKQAVPREIVNKPGRLTPEEIVEMNRHIEHALNILKDVDFQLPVQESIAEMYERLDGSGYPEALSGDAINIRARILGVCDVFCARIRPRSYRGAIAPDLAMTVMSDHPDKYDAAVVEALQEVLRTQEGEKLVLVARTTGGPQAPSDS
ncbi:MAG: PAS domain-containing protein [Rhodospirillaceae bacterium]|nr:PAS domain-containing protein [Rhodospirillaceae bacterium]